MPKLMGAGILPLALKEGEVQFLLSRESSGRDKGLWCHFGGGKERGESYIDTAIREGLEESNGLFGSHQHLTDLMSDQLVDIVTMNGHRIYVVQVKWDERLPEAFKSDFLQVARSHPGVIGKNGMYEKDRVEWVPQRLLTRKRLRHWFKPFAKVFERTNYTKVR